MKIGKYELMYQPKIDRAIKAAGKAGETDPTLILVEYDRLGGLITLDGEHVKRGAFYNTNDGSAHAKPKVVVLRKAQVAAEVEVEEEVEEEEEKPKKKKTAKKAE